MSSVILDGAVNENHKLIVNLPHFIPPGPVKVKVDYGEAANQKIQQVIQGARGSLKESGYSTQKYFAEKQSEKNLER